MACFSMQGCSDEAGADSQSDPKKLEKIFQLYGGKEQDFEEIESPYVLMNYWASWCKPCVKEIPELNALDKNPNTAVYAFNFDRLEGEKLSAEASKFNLSLPMLLNEPAPMFGEPSPAALPATLVVNTQTGEKQWLMGAQTEQKILAALGL
jgi:thiol-disulfide isomerase/thioredoxin